MKITANEEYGLRILIRIAKSEVGMTIAEISDLEMMTHHNTAKICRVLRIHGYIESTLGHTGGYKLAKPAAEINLGGLLRSLGGALYHENFCNKFNAEGQICTNSLDCSIRSLWQLVQDGIDSILEKLTLEDLIGKKEVKPLCG